MAQNEGHLLYDSCQVITTAIVPKYKLRLGCRAVMQHSISNNDFCLQDVYTHVAELSKLICLNFTVRWNQNNYITQALQNDLLQLVAITSRLYITFNSRPKSTIDDWYLKIYWHFINGNPIRWSNSHTPPRLESYIPNALGGWLQVMTS